MSFEFVDRGNMWFGHVFDVYEGRDWIGGVMQGKQDPRWSAVTPYGRGAEPLPFATRDEGARWLGQQGQRVPRAQKWRFSPPVSAVLGIPRAMGLLDDVSLSPFRTAVIAAVGIAGVALVLEATKGVRERSAFANPDRVSIKQARQLGEQLGVDWSNSDFGVAQFRAGIEVEKEHGPTGPAGAIGDVTHGDLLTTAKIALAHLDEFSDYYIRLAALEAAGDAEK
jgi:hypothetical protein